MVPPFLPSSWMDDYLRQMMGAKARRAQLADQMASYNYNKQVARDESIRSNLEKLHRVATQGPWAEGSQSWELASANNEALMNLAYLTGRQSPPLMFSGGRVTGLVGSESNREPLEEGWDWR